MKKSVGLQKCFFFTWFFIFHIYMLHVLLLSYSKIYSGSVYVLSNYSLFLVIVEYFTRFFLFIFFSNLKIMSVTSSGPHPRFLSIREFTSSEPPPGNHALIVNCQLSTVTSYDNTVNNNKLLTTYGSFVRTTLTRHHRYS